MECWGASGGKGHGNSYYGVDDGKGAYVSGDITLTATKFVTYYIYVGNQGAYSTNKNNSGGWNGGGVGYWDQSDDEVGGGGGGATDIRLSTGNAIATIWNNTNSLRTRIIVGAGGGGAGGNSSNPTKCGTAGGLQSGTTYYLEGADAKATIAKQNSGYKFGIGQDGTYVSNGCSAGGGGGWYGGGTGKAEVSRFAVPASGGSSFISGHPGCNAVNPSTGAHLGSSTTMTINSVEYKFSPTVMIDGNGNEWTTANQTSSSSKRVMPNPAYPATNYASGVGHTGNGYARITCKPYD